MTIDFYYAPPSPPSRGVMMLAKQIGIRLNLKLVNVLKGDQFKPDFIEMNPQHAVPTINDNGFILWESRAIMIYLVTKYAKNSSLYPKDPEKRGIVDQRLYFDSSTLMESFAAYYAPVIFGKTDTPPEENLPALESAFEGLNSFLQDMEWVAGDEITIADYSIVTVVTNAEVFGFDIARYENVARWYENCKAAMEKYGFEEINVAGANILHGVYQSNLKQEEE